MSAPLPDALRARFQRLVDEGLSDAADRGARVRTYSQQDDACGDAGCPQERFSASVITGRDATLVHQPGKQIFDSMALSAEHGVVFGRVTSSPTRRNACINTAFG